MRKKTSNLNESRDSSDVFQLDCMTIKISKKNTCDMIVMNIENTNLDSYLIFQISYCFLMISSITLQFSLQLVSDDLIVIVSSPQGYMPHARLQNALETCSVMVQL